MSISAIKVSELEGFKRLDAEYYQPRYIAFSKCFLESPSLEEAKAKIIHPTEVKRIYEEEGLQLLLAQNIRANFLDFSNVGFLPSRVEPEIRSNK